MSNLPTILRANVIALALPILSMVTSTTFAADLTIALREAPVSPDPHWVSAPATFAVNSMVFDPLVRRDEDVNPRPNLAERWERPDDVTWIFHLRRDVKWHDGSPFTAEDVVYSYGRAKGVPGSPATFGTYVAQIEKMEIVDPHTLKITTNGPAPALLERLGYVLIASKKIGEKTTTEDYNAGRGVIGTGPYKFVSWTLNDRTTLEKNNDFFGPKEPWDKVIYRMMPNDAARVAALLAGDIDAMAVVPSQDIARLRSNPAISVANRLSALLCFITLDSDADLETIASSITGPNGEKLTSNPLKDPKVRQALALALDRDAFVKRIFENEADPTGQYLLEGLPGYNPELTVPKADPAKARQLLEEAGWAGKFKIDLSVAQAYFPQSVQVAEAIAQSWTRVGAATTVSAVPYSLYVTNRNARKSPISIHAIQNSSRGGDNFFPPLVHTRQPERGYGILNFNRYSNPAADTLIETAERTMDVPARSKMFSDVAKLVRDDNAIVPLWFFHVIHASKKDLTIKVRIDSSLLPSYIRPAVAAAK